MKRFSILTLALLTMLIISACGASDESQATPTIDPVDLQSTMVAAASTLVAETQAAIPTATATPTATVTNTPAPTLTLPPLPTLGATFTASPVGNPNANDPCITTLLPATLEGETIRIRIDNPTRSTIMVSVNLQQSGPGTVCGYRGYTLTAGQSLVINDLVEGCYTLWAWNPDPEAYFIVTDGTTCVDSSGTWVFDISTGSIKLKT